MQANYPTNQIECRDTIAASPKVPAELLRFLESHGTLPPNPSAPSDPSGPGTNPASSATRATGNPTDVEQRAVEYLATMPESVEFQRGSDALYAAARVVVHGFDLGQAVGLRLLRDHFSPRCLPPWDEKDLVKKCHDADTRPCDNPRGWLRDAPRDRTPKHTQRSTGPAEWSDDAWAAVSGARRAASTEGGPGREAAESGMANVTTAATTPPAQPSAPLSGQPAAQYKGPTTLRNYAIISEARAPVLLDHIVRDMLTITGGWPKVCGGCLFVLDGFTPRFLKNGVELFGYLSGKCAEREGAVDWYKKFDPSKAEFAAYLANSPLLERFDDIQVIPHFPRMPNTFYAHPELAETESGRYQEMLGMFTPATPLDLQLIDAFHLTLLWGGRCGGRPMFVFEAQTDGERTGHGTGKSTVPDAASRLILDLSLSFNLNHDKPRDVENRLLSEQGRKGRLAVFDNVKGSRVSDSFFEGAITFRKISGRELFEGEGSRPNNLTWAFTGNQPSLSKDFAQRCNITRVKPPTYDPAWIDRLNTLIDTHRWSIISDIVLRLKGPPQSALCAGEHTRWADWERDVLCRSGDARELLKLLKDRRADVDDDDQQSSELRGRIVEYVRERRGWNAEDMKILFTTARLAEIFADYCPSGKSVVAAGRWLASVTLRGLTAKRTKTGRVWTWIGNESRGKTVIDYETDL